MGPGTRDTDTGQSTAGRAQVGGMRKGWAGTAAGSGTGLRLHRSARRVPGFPTSLQSVVHLPWSRSQSPCILILDSSLPYPLPRGVRTLQPARAPKIVPGRRGGDRPAADLGAHFPTPPVCARGRSRRGRSGQAPTFPRPGTEGTVVPGPLQTASRGRESVLRSALEFEANLEPATCERQA